MITVQEAQNNHDRAMAEHERVIAALEAEVERAELLGIATADIYRRLDDARETAKRVKRMFEKSIAQAKEYEAKNFETQKAREETQKAQQKEKALKAWLQAGGTEADFDKEWPTLHKDIIKKRALEFLDDGTDEFFPKGL